VDICVYKPAVRVIIQECVEPSGWFKY